MVNGLTTNSNLAVAGFNGLNGLTTGNYSTYGNYGNYGSYGGSFYGYGGATLQDAESAKNSMQNSYSIYATQQGLNNKQQAEIMSYSQQSQNIATLIRGNRNDDAMKEYEKMVQNIKATPQYSTYSDAEIRAIAQAQYQNSTGTNLVNDITQNSSSSFTQGLKMGVPILGWFFESSNSKDDLVSQVTGTPKAASADASKVFGSCLSSAAVGAGGYGIVKGIGALKKSGVLSSAMSRLSPGVVSALNNLKGAGKVGAVIAGIAGVIGIGTAIVKSATAKEA